ncbi:predicted protein [Sclerotinia sclerotiorum 1980 UF-70]|uniref:Uncharacterized protein n=1 Tax=Sclerotinia sclerotiorum (strain ATCC 18683 / 1980 / Ss-1) TaxID=665079 RepID=A7EQF1_SCLS1|nr:predicted protein [Sclerotinia sclerotiorum 1980 UF-70]EDN91693.1 predicted protein [Sclerotinia sclerotiorum 1980 UF-70]
MPYPFELAGGKDRRRETELKRGKYWEEGGGGVDGKRLWNTS